MRKMKAGLSDTDDPFQKEKAQGDSEKVISFCWHLHSFQTTPGDIGKVDWGYTFELESM